MVQVKDKTFEVFITEQALQEQIAVLGQQISNDYAGKTPLFLAILNGAFMFAADLLKHISIPCEISFVKVASYQAMQSSGTVTELIGLSEKVTGRLVIVLEDIVDTGITMEQILGAIQTKGPESVKVATLLFKPDALQKNLSLDYVGFRIPSRFVVGYGLDYDGYGRNLPSLYVLKENK